MTGKMKPLYATISSTGGYYSVVYTATPNTSSTLGSYSGDCIEKLRGTGIPLVDYRTGDVSAVHHKFNGVREACLVWADYDKDYYPTLGDFLERCRKAGVTVSNL